MWFSRRQQHVMIMLFLLYGIWLLWCAYSDIPKTVETSRVADPVPPLFTFYIDPPIDINSAGVEELQLLPAIGPVLAQRIVEYREQYGIFRSLHSLRNIERVGPKTIQKLQHYLTFPE